MSRSVRYSANLSMLFTELPVLQRPRAAAEAGFGAVEIWWPFDSAVPPKAEVTAFARSVEDAGVQLVGLNFFAGDMPAGDRGLVSIPARVREFRDNVGVAVALGARLGCPAFNALYGNRSDDASPEDQDAVAAENLALASVAAADIGAVVLVEPVSGAPHYPLRKAADAIKAIDRALSAGARDNLRLLLDLYHLSVNGDDLDRAITAYSSRTGHVQIADDPGRHEPGTGKLEIIRYLAQLTAAGYDGYVGLEYKPSADTTASLNWLARGERALSENAER